MKPSFQGLKGMVPCHVVTSCTSQIRGVIAGMANEKEGGKIGGFDWPIIKDNLSFLAKS